VQTLFNRARVATAAGNPEAAVASLESILAVNPHHVPARQALAVLAEQRGDLKAATDVLEELRRRDSKVVEPRLHLARILLLQKQTGAADNVLKEALAAANDKSAVLHATGLLYMDAGRYDEALPHFRAAVADAPDDLNYAFGLARAYLALGQSGAARDALERTLSVRPAWIPAAATLALLDLQEKRPEAAIARVVELKRNAPSDYRVHALEGDLLMRMQDPARADQAYGRARELRADAATALKSFRARQLGKLGEVTRPLEEWLEQEPDDFVVRGVLAEAYSQIGLQARAVEEYELIVSSNPRNVVALNNLAWLYSKSGDPRARATAQRAYDIKPDAPAVADTYGWILLQAGEHAESLRVLKFAAEAMPENAEAQYHFASALAANGSRNEARQRLTKLVEQHASFASAADARRLLAELGG
jgi:putative PEP-CTERM system TPR-repeat lipoprotein